MKELKFEELTTRQKLGMTFVGYWDKTDRSLNFILGLIKEHALGAVWIQPEYKDSEKVIQVIKETADYPILIMSDAETGFPGYKIGNQSALGIAGKEAYAYSFGKVTGAIASQRGYNVICSPIVDMIEGGARSLGTDKEKVSSLAVAQVKGMHDGGILCTAKHYPSATIKSKVDTHMAESMSYNTKEELLEYNLYPYLKLMEEGILDGIMTGHQRLALIDPDYPASLSEKVIDIIREQGFDGFMITDSLCMMGIRAKFDDVTSKGLAISAGNDFILPEAMDPEESFHCLLEAYDKGMIADNKLDIAVKRVLEAQHKTTLLPQNVVLSKEEEENIERINRECVYAVTDEGVPVNISRDGKHFFVLLLRNGTEITDDGKANVPLVDTFTTDWLYPKNIEKKIEELFPNSEVRALSEFPDPVPIYHVFRDSLPYEDIIFITHTSNAAYVCPPEFTYRIRNMINALQATNRISTILYFGNPKVLEDVDHIPRRIVGCQSKDAVDSALEVLAGNIPAAGSPVCNVNFK